MKNEIQRRRTIAGAGLILIGLIALAAQYLDLGHWLRLLILPGLGLLFFAWGIIIRQSGLFIPGGILTGLGLGTLLLNGPFNDLPDDTEGAVFMLAFSLGWFLIPVVSAIVTGDNHWWALIPGGIMALIGAALLLGDAATTILEFLGIIWPLFLILGGVYLLLRRSTGKGS